MFWLWKWGERRCWWLLFQKTLLTVRTILLNFQKEEQFLHTNDERSRGFRSVAASVLSVIQQRLLELRAGSASTAFRGSTTASHTNTWVIYKVTLLLCHAILTLSFWPDFCLKITKKTQPWAYPAREISKTFKHLSWKGLNASKETEKNIEGILHLQSFVQRRIRRIIQPVQTIGIHLKKTESHKWNQNALRPPQTRNLVFVNIKISYKCYQQLILFDTTIPHIGELVVDF